MEHGMPSRDEREPTSRGLTVRAFWFASIEPRRSTTILAQ